MNAKFCTSCGKKLEEGMKFCVACGTPVAGTDAADADSGAEEALASLAPKAEEAPAADADATTVVPTPDEVPAAAAEPKPAPEPAAATTLLETPAQPTVAAQPAAAAAQTQPQAYVPPAQTTQQFPAAQPIPATAPTAAYVDETATAIPAGTKPEANRVLIGIIAALVGILIAVGVIFIVKPFGTASTGEQTTASESSDSKSSKSDDAEEADDADDEAEADDESEDAKEENQTETVDETANYNNLTAFYNQLSGLDSEVRSAAATFNAHYLDSSYASRKSYSDAASNLSSRISSLKGQVDALQISSSSKYYTNWQDISTLYNDLLQRIEVMCDAWAIDLSSDNPASNKTAILAPISRDNVAGTNDNQYRLDYEQRYAGAQPQQ